MDFIYFLLLASAPYMLVAFVIFLVFLIPAVHTHRRKLKENETKAGKIIAWQITAGMSIFAFCTYVIPDWDITSPWPGICAGAGLVCAGVAGWHAGSRRWGRFAAAVAGVLMGALNFAMDMGNALG